MISSNKHLYFAYGSNMDQADLDRWCDTKSRPRIIPINKKVAKLTGHKLCFNYYSTARLGGAANIMVSAKDSVWGLLMEISNIELETIRNKEGYPKNYEEIRINVVTVDGLIYKDVVTYKVAKGKLTMNHQPPTKEYLNLIIQNGFYYQFPLDYLEQLKKVQTKEYL